MSLSFLDPGGQLSVEESLAVSTQLLDLDLGQWAAAAEVFGEEATHKSGGRIT